MKKYYFTVLLAMLICVAHGQIVTEKNLDNAGYGEKKLKKAPKKVFINQFFINYQVLSSSSEASTKAKTQMSVGLTGVEVEDFQEITDNAYDLVIEKLTKAGFEIVMADAAGEMEFYSDWTRLKGGTPSQAQLLGYISTAPEKFDYY